MKQKKEIMTAIGMVVALLAAVCIQAAISSNCDDKDTSLQHILASWILRAQAPFHYYHYKTLQHHNNQDDEDDISLQLKVIDWVVENGGYFNPKQEIRRIFPGGPYGVFATRSH